MAWSDAVLPSTWSRANPVDILGDARSERYAAAFKVLARDNEQDAILVLNCPTGVTDSIENAEAVLAARAEIPKTAVLAYWMGEATAVKPRALLSNADIPSYETPDEAVRAFLHLVEYGRNQDALLETPEANQQTPPEARARARAVIAQAQTEGRTLLTEPEAKTMLAAYGVPVVETRIAANPEAAGAEGAAIAGPIALNPLARHHT